MHKAEYVSDNNSSVQIHHRHRTSDLARAWERNSRIRIRGRYPTPFAARGCSAQNAIPLAPRRACAVVRPARAHRAGVATGPAVLPGTPAATSASDRAPPTRPAEPSGGCAAPLTPAATGRLAGRHGPPAGWEGPLGRRSTAKSDLEDPHADVIYFQNF